MHEERNVAPAISSFMRQVLCNSKGALVARVPRPAVEPGCVLVRTRYSLISAGTELAGMAPDRSLTGPPDGHYRARQLAETARSHLAKSLRDPRKAVRKLASLTRQHMRSALARVQTAALCSEHETDVSWRRLAADTFSFGNGVLFFVSDASPSGYQATSQLIATPASGTTVVRLRGTIEEAPIVVGLLNEDGSRWIDTRVCNPGPLDEEWVVKPHDSAAVTLVLANCQAARRARVKLDAARLVVRGPRGDGLPHSELGDQGWNIGYSAAGEVIAVGPGVNDLAPGMLVACAGAGRANHADFMSVPRNLVCRVPAGCSDVAAATATVGAIALQGVRRATPQVGERVCVLGLGMIGQLTAQLLRAAGCIVIGHDLAEERVERARELGIDAAAHEPSDLRRLVDDLTQGHGADRTLITAATRSDSVINLAMELTRAKGTVVIVGDVGLKIERAAFYRKEIDLLMSTSYGPGRYDPRYEIEGIDYPFAYVRWTLNRNMQAYLDLIACHRLKIDGMIDRIVPVSDAPAAYDQLARGGSGSPLMVVLSYADDERPLPEQAAATRITLQGHRRIPNDAIRYALVGAGGFGTGMLVPKLAQSRWPFVLRGVVSRDAARGGNFARSQAAELFASDLDGVLTQDGFDLVVIATRHQDHAAQVIRCLEAGKHVFVEKPLAITWEQLNHVAAAYRRLVDPPLVMVGFNRRFSPAIAALGSALQSRRSPLLMNYRLNGGYIPLDHWVHSPQGGGRNLGEACHIYDLFRALACAPVTDVQAKAIDPGPLPYLRNDNFCATLAYQDGSLANLVYTALGPKEGLSKERLEVFCDGHAFILDDYRLLTRITGKGVEVLWSSDEPDKGHAAEIDRLGAAISQAGGSPIAFDELVETTAVALTVEDLLFERMCDAEAA
jgi:predicted dehydrogenase/threonine dehydrogenase-like Zn-dependent dehydrogenase